MHPMLPPPPRRTCRYGRESVRTTTDELQRLGLAIAGFLECVAAAATAAYWFLSLDDARLKCEA